MNLDNNLLLNDEGFPTLPEIFPVDSMEIFLNFSDITALNDQIAKLNIDLNTQSLRV